MSEFKRFAAWFVLGALLVCGSSNVSFGQLIIEDTFEADLAAFLATQEPVQFIEGDTSLTAAQRLRILNAHATALAQVEKALAYLTFNAPTILAGSDEFYNSTFGQFYDPFFFDPTGFVFANNSVAAGLVDIVNPLGIGEFGGSSITFEDVVTFRSLDLTTGEFGNNVEFFPRPTYTGQISGNDSVYVGGQFFGIDFFESDGLTFEAVDTSVFEGTIGSGEGGGGGGGMGGGAGGMGTDFTPNLIGSTRLVISSIDFFDPLEDEDLENPFDDLEIDGVLLEAFRVGGFTSVANLDHYEQVVDTLEGLRSALLTPMTFTGADSDPAAVLAALGAGTLADLTDEELFATLAFRQFGFSNSMSQAHLDQIANDPTNPLLWVDEDFDTFKAQMTVVAGLDDTMFVGDAFFEGTLTAGGLFDSEPTDQTVDAPDDYQQLIATYLEMNSSVFTDLTGVDPEILDFLQLGAAFGVDEINAQNGTPNGDGLNAFPQNTDAGNFADFLDVDGPAGDDALLDLPPPGKRGAAGPDGMAVIRDPFGFGGFVIPTF